MADGRPALSLERLMWAFAGCFILFGLPLFFVLDCSSRHFWGGLAMICLGGFALAFAWSGVRKGEIRLHHAPIRRADRSRTFWAAVTITATAGVGVIAGAIWISLFEACPGP